MPVAGADYTHTGRLWTATPSAMGVLGTARFRNESPKGWQTEPLASPIRVKAGTPYVATVDVQSHFVTSFDGLAQPIVNGDLATVADGGGGLYGPIGFLPAQSYRSSNYYRDVVFVAAESLVAVDAGGPSKPVREYVEGYIDIAAGVGALSTTLGIDRSGIAEPAPEAVYQTARYGTPAIRYPLAGAGIAPGATYRVRLHFAEISYTGPGERRFNVSANGNPVLTDFDIVAEAGAPYKAVIKEFQVIAQSSRGAGSIVLNFESGSAGPPLVNAVEVLLL